MEGVILLHCKKIIMPRWSISDVPPPLSSIQHLEMGGCPKVIESGREWGLHELSSLKQLKIADEDIESFPEEGLLPPNLQSLSFWRCENMKRINHTVNKVIMRGRLALSTVEFSQNSLQR